MIVPGFDCKITCQVCPQCSYVKEKVSLLEFYLLFRGYMSGFLYNFVLHKTCNTNYVIKIKHYGTAE